MTFTWRIGLTSLLLALITGLLIWRGPPLRDIGLITRSPAGGEVPIGSAVSLTFSRAVDRAAAEQSFALSPATDGRFFWQGNTLSFQPAQPLQPDTEYRVTLSTALRDNQGSANRTALGWTFRTRSPALVLITSAAGRSTVVVYTPGTAEARPPADVTAEIQVAAIAPASGRLLLVEARDMARTALTLLDPQDGSRRILIDEPGIRVSDPAWASGEDFIAYTRQVLDADEPPQIWLAGPDGTSYGPLLSTDEASSQAAWSPDGNQLAFAGGAAADQVIYSFFSNSRRSRPAGTTEAAAWSPDGSVLVYATGSGVDRQQLRRWDLRADADNALTDGRSRDGRPVWSPDGSRIAFVRQELDAAASSIWLMVPDGSKLRRLTSGSRDDRPVWSPDGSRIAFIRSENGRSSAWLVDVASGEVDRIQFDVQFIFWIA
jgi:Tol biopolymer transport system component